MAGLQGNNQREMSLVAEWLSSLPSSFTRTTHVKVGTQSLIYRGQRLTLKQAQRFASWNSWADARVVTPHEVWIVEGKLVATGAAYGQVLDYCNEYPQCADAALWPGRAIVPIVLCQAEQPRTARYFATFGVRTIVFQPTWDFAAALQKVFQGVPILSQG